MKLCNIFKKNCKAVKQSSNNFLQSKNDVITQKIENSFIAASSNIGKRNSQQDYYCISSNKANNAYISILCDGMGGMESGGLASSTAAESIKSAFYEFNIETCDPFDFLENAIFHSDIIVSNLTNENGNAINSGTTLIASIIIKNKLYWASVGDSRIYLIRNNNIQQLTKDQNYGEILLMQLYSGTITIDEANADPQKDALTHYIGIGNLNNINMPNEPLILNKDDIILMCSDGLYRTLETDDILKSIQKHNDNLPLSAWLLVTTAINKDLPHQDNTTVILIKSPFDNNMDESTHPNLKTKDSDNQLSFKTIKDKDDTNLKVHFEHQNISNKSESSNNDSIETLQQRQRPNNGVSVTEIINK